LFDKPSWVDDDGRNWRSEYINGCRQRYIDNYEPMTSLAPVESSIGMKRKHSDFTDDYQRFLQTQMLQQSKNEFDNYMSLPPPTYAGEPLEWWKHHAKEFPRLTCMARDVLGVLATGAGVERQFSLAGRVATPARATLHPSTIEGTMMFKDHLLRQGKALKESVAAGLQLGEDIDDDVDGPGTQ
jgi:hypothetical protein